jgi:hypothetical protein
VTIIGISISLIEATKELKVENDAFRERLETLEKKLYSGCSGFASEN